MCGIYCELCISRRDFTEIRGSRFSIESDEKLRRCINCRGPDSHNSISVSLKFYDFERNALFYSTILWMQGEALTPQPVEDSSGILMFNGDIFDISWRKNVSDTEQIMDMLRDSDDNECSNRMKKIISVLKSLQGPFSIVYYDKKLKILFFARDIIGRNSLLFYSDEESIIISSVLGRKYKGTVEVPASHIYSLSVEDLTISNHDRNTSCDARTSALDNWVTNLQHLQSMSDDISCKALSEQIIPSPEDIDLIQFIETVSASTTCRQELMSTLMKNNSVSTIVHTLTDLLKASVKIRLETQPQKCKKCISTLTTCADHCTVGVLFSGGLDCSILALLADDFLPKNERIDLINVAFKRCPSGSFDVPDRVTGRLAVDELRALRPSREWLFREVNVCEEELRREQDGTIADLVYPRHTVLDESLGSALWFAARAADANSTSTCRVVLLGSGADEIFGGYTRHRNALRRGSWSRLNEELSLDWRRISSRNLARDNRVISHHGRQPRMPYLDEHFTRYALQLKPWERCVPSGACGPGLGDKLFLRLMASELGLTRVSSFPKRALQFGSRVANKKENGSDLSERFKNVI